MANALFRVARSCSVKAIVVACLAAATSMVSGTSQAASINLSTGGSAVWTVDYQALTNQSTVVVPNGNFPIGPWVANDASSSWIAPSAFGPQTAPENTDFVYTTTFNLTDAASLLTGRWLSDNNTVSITLNGQPVLPGTNSVATSFTQWTSLSPNAGLGAFVVGLNKLVFTVHNGAGRSDNPTGFRFEGAVLVGAVPEPSSLVLSAIGALLLGRISWKRRLAHRDA